MPTVRGNITEPQIKTGGSGKQFTVFRLAEHVGKDKEGNDLPPQWYSVVSFKPEDAMLPKGQFVEVFGRLEVESFKRRDNTTGVELKLTAYKLTALEKKEPKAA